MKFGAVVGVFLFVAGAHDAGAACSDDIGKLQQRAQDKGNASISKSSGGQATAAQQEAEHGTGEGAQQLDVNLNAAKVAANKGDEAGRQAALAKARQQLSR